MALVSNAFHRYGVLLSTESPTYNMVFRSHKQQTKKEKKKHQLESCSAELIKPKPKV